MSLLNEKKNNHDSRWLKIIKQISKRTLVINQEQMKLDLIVCATLTSDESRRASNGLTKVALAKQSLSNRPGAVPAYL